MSMNSQDNMALSCKEQQRFVILYTGRLLQVTGVKSIFDFNTTTTEYYFCCKVCFQNNRLFATTTLVPNFFGFFITNEIVETFDQIFSGNWFATSASKPFHNIFSPLNLNMRKVRGTNTNEQITTRGRNPREVNKLKIPATTKLTRQTKTHVRP